MSTAKRPALKRLTILGLLVFPGTMLVSATQPWVSYRLIPTAAAVDTTSVSGSDGAPALLPIAIALLAIGVSLGIVGRLLRVGLGAVTVALGLWVAVAASGVLFGGQHAWTRFGASVLYEATGFAESEHAALIQESALTIWPAVALVCGVLVVCLGAIILVLGWRWNVGGRKYETRAPDAGSGEAPADGDAISDWDALSRGHDPS